jgi:MvdD-like protein with pre-ATP grasp domain/ribosomal protein S6-L-glutamate ligase RimK-like protein
MILILTEPFDPHADHIINLLNARGAEFVRFNPADFPARASLSVGYAPDGQIRSLLRLQEATIDLAQLQSVWNRRPRPSVPHEEIQDGATRQFVAHECHTFVQDLWNALPCCWLPGRPAAIHRAQLKVSQLRLAAQLGLELPPTLITTNREEFLDFYGEHNGNVVSKLAGFSFDQTVGANAFCRYTEVVSKRDVAYAASVQYCPMIFQAYVPKRVELRITVVGREVFAAEIHSQHTNHTRHDWRRYDISETPHFTHELPPEVQERCVRLVEKLELCYGAIDMILTPDGRYVFIEVNPNGQYLWIEEQTGLPISDAICNVLIGGRGALV